MLPIADVLENNRRLCLKKDLDEINLWMYILETFNNELDFFKTTEKKLLKDTVISFKIQNIRRKNVLNMATLCKYENALKSEYDYGKTPYNSSKVKQHQKSRQQFVQLMEEYNVFKFEFYTVLTKFERK